MMGHNFWTTYPMKLVEVSFYSLEHALNNGTKISISIFASKSLISSRWVTYMWHENKKQKKKNNNKQKQKMC